MREIVCSIQRKQGILLPSGSGKCKVLFQYHSHHPHGLVGEVREHCKKKTVVQPTNGKLKNPNQNWSIRAAIIPKKQK